MAEPVRSSLGEAGAYALELAGVGRRFGALAALADVTMSVRAGERRAVLGSNGAGKTTLFNTITGDIPPSSGHHPLLRRGHHPLAALRAHPAGLAAHLPGLAALRGLERPRLDLPRLPRRVAEPLFADPAARATTPRWTQATRIMTAVKLDGSADRLVAELSHGEQRQLEIALAFAGAPRFILFDEPAAGLSPHERRDLVAILTSLPAHIGYIIIEHDLDVALRVAERVTMMHNGRIFKEGTPEEIENDPEVQEIYLGAAMAESAAADPPDPRPAGLLWRVARHPGRRAHGRAPRPVARRPQRHGQDDALQHHRRPQAGAQRLDPPRRRRDRRARAARHRPPRHRLRAARPAGLAQPHGRRAPPRRGARRGRCGVDGRADLRDVSAARRAAGQSRRAAFRRRAADARDRRGRFSATRASWSWTSRPRAWRRSSSTSWSRRSPGSARRRTWRSFSSSRTSASPRRLRRASRSWSTAASIASWQRPSSPATATCSSACLASGGTTRPEEETPLPSSPRPRRGVAQVFRVVRGGGRGGGAGRAGERSAGRRRSRTAGR